MAGRKKWEELKRKLSRNTPSDESQGRPTKRPPSDPMVLLDRAQERQIELDRQSADAAQRSERVRTLLDDYLRTNVDALASRRVTFQISAAKDRFALTHRGPTLRTVTVEIGSDGVSITMHERRVCEFTLLAGDRQYDGLDADDSIAVGEILYAAYHYLLPA